MWMASRSDKTIIHGKLAARARWAARSGRSRRSSQIIDLVLGAYVMRLYYLHPRTDDAYVRANIAGVAPEVSGKMAVILKPSSTLLCPSPHPW
jgi:multidrug resistance efflux pump